MDASRAGGSRPYRAPLPAGASRFGAAAPAHLQPAHFAAGAQPLAAEFRPIRAVGGATDARPVGAVGGAGAPTHLQPSLFAAGAHPLAAESRPIRAVGGATDARPVGAISGVGAPAHLQPAFFAAGAHPLATEFRPVRADGGTMDARPFGVVGGAADAHSLDVGGCSNTGGVNRFSSGDAAASRTLYTAHVGDPRSWEMASADSSASPIVRKVWRENSALEFMSVVNKLRLPRRRLFIALDLEYVAHESTDIRYRPISNADWYQHLRDFVNDGAVVQLGLVLAFEECDPSGGDKQLTVMALEINIQLDVNLGTYNTISLDFLREQGHNLDKHRDQGVFPEWVFAGLLQHLPFGDHSTIWITYHGDRDLGFLLRLLQAGGRGVLPPDRATFLHQMKEKFPVFYDVRVLGQIVIEGFAGKLTKLAESLGINHIGDAHFAASDAVLTLSCFWKILRISSDQQVAARLSLLSGTEEFDMAIKCARNVDDCCITTIDVTEQNFDEEARRISELVNSNFKTIGLNVILPKPSSPISRATNAQQEYELMKRRLTDTDTFEILISFMNADGKMAYGRIWSFRFSLKGTSGYIDSRRLAQLLASSGVTHNTKVSWVTYDASHGMGCLIKSFMTPHDLPVEPCSYMCHRIASFPVVYDMGFVESICPDICQLLARCNGAPGVQLLLRCFKKLSEREDFSAISSASRGMLMVG